MERKLLITISVGLFLIVLISFFLLFGLKVRFLISEELRVELTPSSIHLETQRDPRQAQVEITTHTFFQCTARCEYELRDLSKNKTLKKSSVLFDKHTNEQLSFTLEPPQRGEGINYYSFDMQCQNIRSSLCLTQEKPILKTALITLNYTYTQDERIAKTFLEDVLPRLAQNISQADARLNASINLLKKVAHLEESKQLLQQVQTLKLQTSALRAHVESLIESYNTLDFFGAAQRLSVQDQKDIITVDQKSEILLNQSIKTINEFNNLQEVLSTFPLEKLKEIAVFYNKHAFNKEYEQVSSLINDQFMSLKQDINKSSSIEELRVQINDLFTTSSEIIINYELIKTEAEELFGVNFSCELFESVIEQQKMNTTNNTDQENQTINATPEGDTTNQTVSNTTNTSRESTSPIKLMEAYFDEHCSNAVNNTVVFPEPFTPHFLNTSYELRPQPLIPLNKHEPQCCIHNECSICGSSPKTPVLFIHGHAFNEANTPEFSMNSFAKIQKKLEEEGIVNVGELDSAQIVPKGIFGAHNKPTSIRSTYYYITIYDVGRYEVQTQKSERIENYAIRLAEIIRDVKERTGSDQVIIVAHSMGGLVAREYMALFGDEEIKKLITINTPHKGIKGKVKKFCTLLGSPRECNDMSEGSVFLTRLNARPLSDKIVVVRATGCPMDGGEMGDGIVTETNAYLEGVKDYLFNGTCTDSLQTDLHGRLLDPEEFPQVYEVLVEEISSK